MTKKFAVASLSLALSIGMLIPLNPAHASSDWPVWSPDANATTTFDFPGSSNSSDMNYFVDNSSGTGIYFLEFKMLGFVLNMVNAGPTTPANQTPTSGNKLSFNGSGGPLVDVWMDQGTITSTEITANSYIFYLNNWTGRFNLTLKSQELISGNSGSSFRFFGSDNNTNLVYSSIQSWPSAGSSPAPSNQDLQSAPAKYAGPEFSSLSLKPVMHGSSTTLTGKRLSLVSSIEIGGKAATFTATSDTELSLTPAADLAPGNYDLVINSAAGKLTHINAVRVQPALRPFSITTRSEDRITESQYYEHSLIAAMQQPELTKARCIVNGPNLAQAKAQAERLCALVKAANPNIETTVIDPRSTVKNNTVFARVTYGWN